jgi:hypothetical protein
VKLFTPQK